MPKRTVVLISPYCREYVGIRSIYFHLLSKGFDVYLMYFGKYEGFDTKYLSKKEYDILIDLLKKIKPSIVAISMLTFSFNVSVDITKKIREHMNPLIVFGGIHAITKPEECIKHADVVCEWEGEESLAELCHRFFHGKDYSNIPNLWVKKKNRIIKNPIRPIENLDSIALPNFKSKNFFYINNGKVVRSEWQLSDIGEYYVLGSRGCPNRCTYCINSTLAKKLDSSPYKGKYVRRRSVDSVIAELKLVKEHFKNIKKIRFYDDVMTLDLDWLEKFSSIYPMEIGIPFWCNTYPAFVNKKALLLLKKAGVTSLNIGIESGSQRFREKVYKRYTSNEKILEVVKIAKKNKMNCVINLILDNPLETDEDLRDGVRFMLSLPRPIPCDFRSLINYPSTELTERLLKCGLIEKADISFEDSCRYRVSKKHPYKRMRNKYWFYIFNFIPKGYIPKSLIIFLTKDIFVKNPRFLIAVFNVGNRLYQLKEKLVKLKTFTFPSFRSHSHLIMR